ncbi:amino acid adenylation domain-containing protein [Nonomuraea maritima]|uniref:amino acid adenylation domain-containing protein n=1 Tax=Nonomuraea maritima TaxID=683260 RepID=UPI00371AFE26
MTATDSVTGLEDAYPLTALQAGMLFHSAYQDDSATYHDVFTLMLRGTYRSEVFRSALADVMARHPVLRTSFDLTGFDEPIQLVWDDVEPPVHEIDLSGFEDPRQRLGIWREEEKRRPFDWEAAPLFRAVVHHLAQERFALTLSFHHAILDGWSVATLVTELLGRYAARFAGEPAGPREAPKLTFRDFVAREKAAVASAGTGRFWRDVLADAPAATLPRLPGYRTGDAEETTAHAVPLGKPLVAALQQVARQARVPLRTVLLAGHLRVLALLTGDADAVTGLVTHGRPEHEAAEQVLGLFLNSVPVRVRTDAGTWQELVKKVFDAEVALLPHRLYPLFEMQRLTDRSPVIDVLFDYRDFHVYRDLGPGGPIEVMESEFFEQTNLPLSANFTWSPQSGELELKLKYDVTQFSADQVLRMGEYYHQVFTAIAADSAGDPRGAAELLARDVAALEEWNATGPAHPFVSLPEAVARKVAATPDAPAVCGGDGVWLSYAEFGARVSALASVLRERGVRLGDVVGVCLPRGVDLVVAVHAVMAAGGAYLPLEPEYPDERLTFMVADAGARVVITEAPERFDQVETVSATARDAAHEPVAVPQEAPAYVIYTSGSTGRPKGVVVSHRAIANRLAWMGEAFPLGADDRVVQKTPFTFDVSVWELFWPLVEGAGLVVAPPGAHLDAPALVALMRRERVSVVHFVPSMLDAVMEVPDLAVPSLRRVVCSGEALPSALVARVHQRWPGVEVHNLYGPTEAAVDVTRHPCRVGEERTPIGAPVRATRIEILDADLRRVPVGTAGQLCIGGVQVAEGYVRRPGLTAERFVPDPYGPPGSRLYLTGDLARWLPHGEVDYLGRMDDQVKVRGMRVEPGEIEAVLVRHPEVQAAAVRTAGDVLAAYVVGRADDLVGFLRERLPEHMIPASFTELERLPVTANGKLDRGALPDPAPASRAPYEPPRDDLERTLTEIWADILGVERVGIRDDFFDLGGHSLLALRLALRMRQELDREVPVATVLAAPTVASLVEALADEGDNPVSRGRVVPLRTTGRRPPLFLVHALGGQVFRYRPLAQHLGEDQPVYAIPAHGLTAGDPVHTSIDEMAESYAGYIREIAPEGPYFLGGFCIGGNIALEVARRLRASGASVPYVFLAWSSADEPVVGSTLEDDTALMVHALAGGATSLDPRELSRLEPAERLLRIVNAATKEGQLRTETDDLDQIQRYVEVFRANAHAVGRYRHDVYDGPAVLLIPEEDDAPADEDYGWRPIVPGLDTGPIPGARFSALYEPYVTRTAHEWRRWMDRGLGHADH